jgi:hypothetical protein
VTLKPLDSYKTRATGTNVILRPREDLFSEVDRETGIELVSLANSVTSVPDNIACCEIVSVGEQVTNLKPGDLAFIDFFWCKQGFVLERGELYICGADSFVALFDEKTGDILPLDNYVVTKRALDRFKAAWFGTDTIEVPRMLLTDGIPGGKTSDGSTATTVLYEEVVCIGKLTGRPAPGHMLPSERALLDDMTSRTGWVAMDTTTQRLIAAVHKEREERKPDIKPGELVVLSADLSQRVRCKGEFWRITHYDHVYGAVDDQAILAEAIERGKARLIAV